MNVSRNSGRSRLFEIQIVVLLLIGASGAALTWFYQQGYLLYWGDAVAHLNIARRVIDSRTPGYAQIGTVWLPLPHLLMLPFVGNDALWRSGLAGAIPAAGCFVAAGAFLYATLRRVFGLPAAALGLAAMALNPNLLYLQSIPMTEVVYLACLCALAYFTVLFRERPRLWIAGAAGTAALAGTLVRYEGWFLLPFVSLFFLRWAKRWTVGAAFLFGAVAAVGPLYWLGHNLWFYGDALEFYHGEWSAKAIYQRALDSGMQPYPGDGEFWTALRYYLAAVRLTSGSVLSVLGAAGLGVAVWKRKLWPAGFFALPIVFYTWSLYSSGTPIFVPHLWPYSYYNTRYGLAVLPLLALGAGALVTVAPSRFRGIAAASIALVVTLPWYAGGDVPHSWVCWKESQVNSEQRRAWTAEAADYLRKHYHGGGILTSFGDLTGIFLEAGIPLRETLHRGNGPEYLASVQRPDLFLREKWAVAISGDEVATTLLRAQRDGPRYQCVKMIALKDAPVIEIYRRISYENTFLEGAGGRQ